MAMAAGVLREVPTAAAVIMQQTGVRCHCAAVSEQAWRQPAALLAGLAASAAVSMHARCVGGCGRAGGPCMWEQSVGAAAHLRHKRRCLTSATMISVGHVLQ